MRTAVAVALTGAALVAVASPAAAASLVVEDATADRSTGTLTVRVSAEELPAGAGLDPRNVVVRVDGRDIPATATASGHSEVTDTIRVIVAIDTSGSMSGTRIAAARRAVTEFVSAAPAHAEVGVLTFAATPTLLAPPSSHRGRALSVLSSLEAGGGTALYDGVAAALHAVGATGDRRLVVISDGADTKSRTDLAGTLRLVRSSGAVVDVIGLGTDAKVTAVLSQLAQAGRGRMLRADSGRQLGSALVGATRTYATELTVSALLPRSVAGRAGLDIQVASSVGVLTAVHDMDLGGQHRVAVADERWLGSRESMLAGLAAIAGSLLLGVLALGFRGRETRRMRRLVNRYTTSPPAAQHTDLRESSPVTRSALKVAENVVQSRGLQDRLQASLERAALSLAPSEWVLLQAGVSFFLVLLLIMLGRNIAAALLVGLLVGPLVMTMFLRIRGSRRQAAFEAMLPDSLQMVAGSLSAGYSLAQALDGIVREGSEPMASEIGRALAESRLGVPVESTLETVATRMGSKDFGWVVMAIRVQREVGGNLAGVLTQVSATMRERAMLRRHVKALSAEGRLSAYILLALPPLLAVYMLAVRREYIEPLYTTGIGMAMIAGAGVLMVIGTLMMNKIVKVEV